jgi:hypothetical protein
VPCSRCWTGFRSARTTSRFSFDRKRGDLILGDVGEADYDEINVLPGAPVADTYGSETRIVMSLVTVFLRVLPPLCLGGSMTVMWVRTFTGSATPSLRG